MPNNQGPLRRWASCLARPDDGPPLRDGGPVFLARYRPRLRWAHFGGRLSFVRSHETTSTTFSA
eukprot:6321942-Pyramimonas_sp.AAC.1